MQFYTGSIFFRVALTLGSNFFLLVLVGRDFTSDTSGKIDVIFELQTLATNKDHTPFWFRTNLHGGNPISGVSGSAAAYIGRDYAKKKNPALVDWGFGVSGRANVGSDANLLLIEAYVKGRLSIFQLKAGRSRDLTGLVDTSLSSGAFSVAGNSLGIPKIELSIPEYWVLPYTKKLVALKGNFSYGWFGTTDLRFDSLASKTKSFYHQKSLYGRIAKPHWRLKLYGGFNHLVMWGNEQKIIGHQYDLSGLESFVHVLIGKAVGGKTFPRSKIGNHLGSLDQAIEYDFKPINVTGYHQFFYEVGGLYHGNNLKDGLWGIVLRNKIKPTGNGFTWSKLLLEYMGSKSQGGEMDAPVTPSGDEDYYNNYIYAQGWTYKGENIGNNFFTQRKYARVGQVMREKEIIINNRVKLYHVGAEGYWGRWNWQTKLSFSRNFGTYASSHEGTTTGSERWIQPPPYFSRVSQFSGCLEAGRSLKNNYRIGFAFAVDQGQLLYNSAGGLVKLSKSW